VRVLLLADACNPDWPSLPSVGYHFALSISRYADVVVATQIRNRPNIESRGMANIEVVYLDTEKIAAPLYKLALVLRDGSQKGWSIQTLLNYPSYLAFERSVWKRFQAELEKGVFDLVHRITPLSTYLPSYMADRCPVPFLLGPINGHLSWPDPVSAVRSRESSLGDRIAEQLLKASTRLPYYKSTFACSSGILASFEHTLTGLPKKYRAKTINFPEIGLDPKLFARNPRRHGGQMAIIFVGRLVPLKMPNVLLQAFAGSQVLRQHKLVFVGEGPERPQLEKTIIENQLQENVELLGQQSLAKVAELMRQADIFALPSVNELGGGVVVEAMACGLACVVVDHGGPATMIADGRGVKLPVGSEQKLIEQLKDQLELLVADPERINRLGEAAYRHAMRYYTWDAKARKTMEIYDWLTGTRAQKPNFWD